MTVYPGAMARKLNLEIDLDPQITGDEAGGHGSSDAALVAERPPHHDRA